MQRNIEKGCLESVMSTWCDAFNDKAYLATEEAEIRNDFVEAESLSIFYPVREAVSKQTDSADQYSATNDHVSD